MTMDALTNLFYGFAVAIEPWNLCIALIGVVVGTAVGVLPGLGPTATVSLLLPISVSLNQTSAIILLAAIYYGAMYGGSITSILIRVPGEAASAVTSLDGYAMTKQGRAGVALGISAFGSFIAGLVATFGIVFLGPSFADKALAFGPIEKTGLVLFGLTLAASVGSGSKVRAWAMVGLGLLLSTVGVDLMSGEERFTFGSVNMRDGIDIAVLAMGLFGVSEVLSAAERKEPADATPIPSYGLRDLLPGRADWKASGWPIARGTTLGFLLGLLPGGGALISSFASYVMEKKLARNPERFGRGAIEGVAGPESANNAAAQASFVPLLCLGIPPNAVIGVIMGALLMQGVTPGPELIVQHPDLFWGVIASMLIGNAMLLILNIPLVRFFVMLLRVPQAYMTPCIMLFCTIGAFSINNSMFDVGVMIASGFGAYALRKAGFDLAPLLLAFLLGSLLEQNVEQSLIIATGDYTAFLRSPISLGFLIMAAAAVLFPIFASVARGIGRRAAAQSVQQ